VGPAGVDEQERLRSRVSREGTLRSGSFNIAYRHLKRSVELERNADAFFFLGFTLAEVGWLADARRYADKGFQRDPPTYMTPFRRSVVDLFDSQFDEAVARCREWASREGVDARFGLWWLGQALACAGRDEEARATFEPAAAMGPGLFAAMCKLGRRAFSDDRGGPSVD